MTLTLTSGDTAPTLELTVNANLTGATAQVHIKRPRGETIINRAATIVDAATGRVSMAWLAGDLTVKGDYKVEVQVTYSNGQVQTFATDTNGRAITFGVREQIA